MADDEGFLRRWSRRKGLARRTELPMPAEDGGRPDALEGTSAPEAIGDEPKAGAAPQDETEPLPQIAVEDLPDIESLGMESDFTVFLQDGVPEALRRKALQRLWRLDPVFANLDGLLEYGEDYTDAATVVENLKTAYRVGRGFMTDEEVAEAGGAADTPESESATRPDSAEPAEESKDAGEEDGQDEVLPAPEPADGPVDELADKAIRGPVRSGAGKD